MYIYIYMLCTRDGESLCLTMCELTRQGAFSSAFYRFASLCRVCFRRVKRASDQLLHRQDNARDGGLEERRRKGRTWKDGKTKEDKGGKGRRGFVAVSSERRKEDRYERASVRLFVRQLW